jgi:competence protein ComEC
LQLKLRGMVRAGRRAVDSRNFDERRWLWLRNGSGVMTVSGIENTTIIGFDRSLPARFSRGIDRFKQKLQSIGRQKLSPASAGLLEGLLLGESSGISARTWQSFRATGTIHLLVVSGLQVGLVGLWIRLLLGWAGLSGALMYGVTALSLVVYAVMTGLNPPIVRATVIGVLVCAAYWRGVAVSIWNLLGAAALEILWINPRVLADPGFQLSFASVFAIVAIGQWQSFRETPKTLKNFLHTLEISTAAWLATAPILWIHFQSFSWVGPLINLIAVPWASALTALGFLVYAVGLIHTPSAGWFAAAFEWAGEWFIKTVDKISLFC